MRQQEGDAGERDAEQRDQLQRIAREADDAVQADQQRAEEAVVLARAGRPRIAVVEHARLAEARPARPARAGSRGSPSARRRCRRRGGSSAGSRRCSAGISTSAMRAITR